VGDVTAALDGYDSAEACRRIEEFVDGLSNWYVRRSRRRFWKSESDEDKLSAYTTLYTCLTTLTRLLAPSIPFVAEELYQNLVRPVNPAAQESVHLTDWPVADASKINQNLSEATRLAIKVASLGRAARQKAKIKVRQPLNGVLIKPATAVQREYFAWISPQLLDELNVKGYSIVDESSDMFQQARLAIGDSPQGIVELSWDALSGDRPGKRQYAVAVDSEYMVAIDTTLTAELEQEGLARELVHRIQTLRRAAGFDISDRIVTSFHGPEAVRAVMDDPRLAEYIRGETLSIRLEQAPPPEGAHAETQRVDGMEVTLGVRRV
jgi:isoleucyl-tRNA synthetase